MQVNHVGKITLVKNQTKQQNKTTKQQQNFKKRSTTDI
jgi:hypothetical protein